MNRRRSGSIASNPVLVGAVTTLVVTVAVFLAYNANDGLPFVPTRQVSVQVANGTNLVKGNEIRSGGYRVGIVTDMAPVRLSDGRVVAEITMKLDEAFGEVPTDSSIRIRARSALGLKYVELTRGTARTNVESGGSLPAGQATASTDIDTVYDTFDEPTRTASQENLQEFGNALTGRGGDLNRTIRELPELFGRLSPVARNLSAEPTQLTRFFDELADAARIIAPVSKTQARLFTTMATTLDAIGRDPQALQNTIAKGPDTLRVATSSLITQRPFLRDTVAFSRDLKGATAELRGALPVLNRALAVGTPVTRRSPELSRELGPTFASLRDFSEAPTTNGALRGLQATIVTLQPQLRYLGPYITVCNSFTSLWTFAAEHLSAPNATGSEQRALINQGAQAIPGVDGNDSVTSNNANEFAHGKVSSEPGTTEQQLHGAFHGDAIDEQGGANCEVGQQGYIASSNPFRDRSNGDPYRRVVVDHPSKPNVILGPSFSKFDDKGRGIALGPSRVPAGQTFTVRPGGRGADTPDPTTYSTDGGK
ncbi:MAG: MCE family protein [Solirubrobacterales bacterium]|nr:MCE family protein [Solirubrobacterales bacterium]